MNHPEPDNGPLNFLADLFFSNKPYDPCDLLDPRNAFLFEDDWIKKPHKDLNPETGKTQGLDENKDDLFHKNYR